jgi:hypothetical protein
MDHTAAWVGRHLLHTLVAVGGAGADSPLLVSLPPPRPPPPPAPPPHNPQPAANWRFQGIVKGLPWRPLLAAAGSTTHVIDPQRGAVVEHIERWKADPKEVVLRLLRPGRTPPGTAWETFMLSLSNGDFAGMWYVLSPRTIPLTGLVGAAAIITRIVSGHGFPGTAGSVVEVVCAVLLPAALITEVVKFSGGLQGGETGTGGRF